MEKYQLLQDFFDLGGNHKPKELKEARHKMVEYLKTDDDTQIKDTILVIDAMLEIGASSDITATYKIAEPIFERLGNIVEWDFIDIRLFTFIAPCAENFEESYLLVKKSLEQLENFKHEKNYLRIKTASYCNFAGRLLKAKCCDAHYQNQATEIDNLFAEYIDKAIVLCVENNFPLWAAVALIRKGLYYNRQDLINKGLDTIKAANEDELYRLMEKEIKDCSPF